MDDKRVKEIIERSDRIVEDGDRTEAPGAAEEDA